MNLFRRKQDSSGLVFGWLIMAGTLVVLIFVHVSLQQNYRQSANDPQIQIAEDMASALEVGKVPKELVEVTSVDPSKSLSSFLVITDEASKVLASDMMIGTDTPLPPKGVLESAKMNGQNRVTWQPKEGVRIALVVEYFKNDKQSGYVLAGRSLREIDVRVQQLTLMTVMIGSLVVFVSLVGFVTGWRK